MLIILVGKTKLLFLNSELSMPILYVFIFNFDNIFLIFVNNSKKFTLYFDEMVTNLVFVEEVHFFFLNKIWVRKVLPERISMSSMFFFFIVEFQ